MMSARPERAHCAHRILEGTSVHEFVLMDNSRTAVNELFDITEEILFSLPPPLAFPALIDASHGIFAVSAAFSRIRQLAQKYPNRDRSKIAMLMPDTSLMRVIAAMMRPFGTVHVFLP